ncbi:MAG TPA: hypothetical protein VLJ37_05710 [bacterium]|nr:hypothetical protein [bacterium]
MKRILLSIAFFLAAASAGAQPAVLPELSADVQMVRGDQVFGQGKIYMSKTATRMEMTMQGMSQPLTNVSRLDRKVMWMLMPNKTYMEQPLPWDHAIVNEVPAGWTQDCSPGDLIDGHPTDMCLIKGTIAGRPTTTTIWKAKDLNGIVIRNMGAGNSGMVLKNIVTAPQPANLFEIPADYKKVEMPSGVAGRMKKRAK